VDGRGRKWFKKGLTELSWALVAAVAVEGALGLLHPDQEVPVRCAPETSELSVAYSTSPEWRVFVDDVK
jgi:hypothetical protein